MKNNSISEKVIEDILAADKSILAEVLSVNNPYRVYLH